jgi:secreted trypsin-like serine protease
VRRLFSLLAVLAMSLATVTTLTAPARAITGDYVLDNQHPFVGLLVLYDENGDFIGRCSGSLLTPTVFLTAGHCTDGASSARVYFQRDVGVNYDPVTQLDPTTGYPDYCAAGTLGTLCATSDHLYTYGSVETTPLPNTRDVGLVILDQPIALPEYGSLAAPGFLDRLATHRGTQETTFTASGYGLSYKTIDPNKTVSFRQRLMATSKLTNLRSALTDGFNLQTNGHGTGHGGTCNGDSGGPVFYGGYSSNIIVAVTSFGLDRLCRGTDFAYRVDTVAVQNWIRSIIGASEFSKIRIVG